MNTGGQSLSRVLAAVEGFFVTHGAWPTSIRLTPGYIEHLQGVALSPVGFSRLTEKLALVPDPSATVVAQNDLGLRYDYGATGFPKDKPPVRARDWIGLDNL